MERALRVGGVALITALLLTTLEGQTPGPSVQEYPAPLVRERQLVVVGNVAETWELKWKAPPKPACEPSDTSLTCPCTGFAYGEGGDLMLVRFRNGEEIDRLELTQFFKDTVESPERIAILQRWEPNDETDFEASAKDDFLDVVNRRPTVKIMDFIDYDHDGQRSEFFLQTITLPCGKRLGVVVGVSSSNQKLHAFGTATKPVEDLVLQKDIWEAFSHAQGPIEVVDWPCGDHGSDEETTVRLEHTNKGIDGVRRTFACPRYPGQHPIREEPL
jgi:hypothetical protein